MKKHKIRLILLQAYYDTNDIDQALWIHRMVRLLARYILLYDRFFELGENKYKRPSKKSTEIDK